MFAPKTTLRPQTDADRDFLRQLYASTRQQEMDMLADWSPERKQAFLASQFHAQSTHYAEYFPDATFDVVELKGEPVGRLYVDRRDDEIRIVDIALVPEVRGQGLGGRLMNTLLAEGRRRGLPVRIHVERDNPAMRLYRRLGFDRVEDQGVYWLMEWRPERPDPRTESSGDAGKES